ncbi:MAG: hypothetical protein KatS3mg076_0062 [Candidatus Binatia bacterium]|nr:MAG: hypothetical protein KatS3mg076_0062 [Candidatus Binatia bacterium]
MLRRADVRRLLAVASVVAEAREPGEFARRAVTCLRRLVACDSISYNEVDPERGRLVSLLVPESLHSPEVDATFSRYLDQHPLIQHHRKVGDARPVRFSDVIALRDLHRLDVYQQGFRPLGTEHQIAFALPAPPPLIVGIALNRSGADFSDRDRDVLDLIRGPLGAAYQRVRERDSVARALEAVEAGERAGVHVVLLDARGRIAWIPPALPEWIRSALGFDASRPVPAEPLRSWLERARDRPQAGGGELRVGSGNAVLRVRYVPRPAPGAHDALVIDEGKPGLSVEALQTLPLTPREAEVLLWVARGKTNEEIGAILDINPRTVQKHLERIFEKSGTFSRTGAVAWALDRLGYGVFGSG